jgi:hypothetical protein
MANDNAENVVYDDTLPEPMTWDEVERAVGDEADSAIRYCRDTLSPERIQKWDRYYGKPLGNEIKGRSQYMSRDLLETVEWILPTLIKTLASGDAKVKLEIEGQPSWVGPALMRKIYDDLSADAQGSMFYVFYQWFKDALVSGTAYTKLFWDVEYEEKEYRLPYLSKEQFDQLDADENADIRKASFDAAGGGYSDVLVSIRKLRRDQLVTENIPTWEFVHSRRARTMNDEHPKGQITYVTMDYLKRINRAMTERDDEPYFVNLQEVERNARGDREGNPSMNSMDAEKQSYLGYERYGDLYDDSEATHGLKARVQLEEWYTRLDIKGTGYLQDVICWRANGKLIRWEDNHDGFISMASISPILDCYKFTGTSYADLVVELQNLKTMLFRRVLDNFDWQNLGRWFKMPGARIDVKALMEAVPGDCVEVDLNSIRKETPEPFHPQNLSLFDYLDGVKEQRTGSTKYTQGTDSGTLNKTAQGIQMIQAAAMQRIELVARIFAEGLKDYYQKAALLYQRNMRKPFVTRVNGEDITVTREMIQGEVYARVYMGVEAQIGMAESQRLERMAGTLQGLEKMAPGLYGAEQIHNMAAKYVSAMGYINTEDFLTPMKVHLDKNNQIQQMQQQVAVMQQELAKAKQQVEQTRVEADIRIEREKLNVAALKIQQDAKISLAELQEQRNKDEREAQRVAVQDARKDAIALAKMEEERSGRIQRSNRTGQKEF